MTLFNTRPRARANDFQQLQVRKAGGVFYTPAHVVDFIVRETVGPLLEGKSSEEAAQATILDPACGTGRFLIGAYQFLLDWHLQWYVEDGPRKHRKELCQDRTGDWQLAVAERQRILQNSIYGVDLDREAIEEAKQSLLRMALWDAASDSQTLDLPANIKCGNALVGPDYFDSGPSGSLDVDERQRINPFDWHGGGGFRAIMEAGGFGAVIGNPPYVNIRILTRAQGERVKDYFKARYTCATRGYDLYVLFIERSLQLLQKRGRFGLIVPNKIGTLDYALACRELLLREATLLSIVDASASRVFAEASVYSYVLIGKNEPPPAGQQVRIVHCQAGDDLKEKRFCEASLSKGGNSLLARRASMVEQSSLCAAGGFAIHGELDVESRVATVPLDQRCQLDSGTTGFVAQEMAQSLVEQSLVETQRDSPADFEFIVSGNIDRYAIALGSVRFMKRTFARPVLPVDAGILTPRKRKLYASQKIVIAGMTRRLEAAWDVRGLALGVQVFAATGFCDPPLFLLGLLNSKLLSHLFRLRFQAKHLAGGYLAINLGQLAKLPVRIIDLHNRQETEQREQIVQLVEQMLQQPIEAVDRKIDQLVYELYGLSEEETASVEAAA